MRRATHTYGEVVAFGIVAFVFGLALMFATMRDLAGMDARASVVNTCNAPCVVTFDNDIEEDEVGLDYHDGVVDVWRTASR